jgi:hypothetical protein
LFFLAPRADPDEHQQERGVLPLSPRRGRAENANLGERKFSDFF